MKRQIRNILWTVVLCVLFAVPAFAAQQGSLLLIDVENKVTIYPVADKTGVPSRDFAGVAEILTAKDLTPETAKKLYQIVQDKELAGQTGTPDEKKELYFGNLQEGWYLVCSTAEKAEFTPFLISVPLTIGDETIYHIQAEPKVDSPLKPPFSDPIVPDPDIPQTGAILWPKYLLLSLGALAIVAGLVEVIRGREKPHE